MFDLYLATFGVSGVTIALAASAIATGIGTYVSVQGQRSAADAAKKTADYNASVQRTQAAQEMEVAKENARRKARENARLLGRQRALVAQSGLVMEGTPLAILGESATILQRDILDMGYEAQQRSRSLQAGASMSLWEGKQQSSALKTEALTTGLQGAGKIAGGYLNYKGY
jgi:hypothetical protein